MTSSSSSKTHEYYYVEDEVSVGQIEQYLKNPNVVEIRRIDRPHNSKPHKKVSSSSSSRGKKVKKRRSSSSSAGGKKKGNCKSLCIIGWIIAAIFIGLFIGYLIAYIKASEEVDPGVPSTPSPPFFVGWPDVASESPFSLTADLDTETEFIEKILGKLTLEAKIGQMIQPALNVSNSVATPGMKFGPADIAKYGIGTMLNGGGGWLRHDLEYAGLDGTAYACPGCYGYGTEARAYARFMEELHIANEQYWTDFNVSQNYTGDAAIRIPFMYATDAVHGHNNVLNSTLFPHNIGLGAMMNAGLMEKIGSITAKEVSATAMDWTFAPAVSVPRFDFWGRTYEGYCEDPALVYDYAKYMVRGIQGSTRAELQSEDHVISNIKHFLGDGGTLYGTDRGVNNYSEDDLINIHGAGYFSGLAAGAQVVMASFNSWNNVANYDFIEDDGIVYNGKLHGSKYILTDVLKDRMGFDGIVVTDWNGHTEINGCTATNCNQLINAGVDIVMIPETTDWAEFADNTIKSTWDPSATTTTENPDAPLSPNVSGDIDIKRIDDAVRRILRVKYRAGLFDRDSPLGVACHSPNPNTKACSTDPASQCTFTDGDLDAWTVPVGCGRANAGRNEILGSDEHLEVARQAVRESLVLLKNEGKALPMTLDTKSKVCIVGSASQDWSKINGGWTLTWQGGDSDNVDTSIGGAFAKFEHPTTAIERLLVGAVSDATVTLDETCVTEPKDYDYIVAMIGEDPYAEMIGDLKRSSTLEYQFIKTSYQKDTQLILDAREAITADSTAVTKIITLFFSGRPLMVNTEIDASDAFVAAWLPGAGGAGAGITDVIVSVPAQQTAYDFKGTLPRTWPKDACHYNVRSHPTFIQDPAWTPPSFEKTYDSIKQWNTDNPDNKVLEPWEVGYGLNYSSTVTVGPIITEGFTSRLHGCLVPDPATLAPPTAPFALAPPGTTFMCSQYENQYSGLTMQKPCQCFSDAPSSDVCGDRFPEDTTLRAEVDGDGKGFTFSTGISDVLPNQQVYLALPAVTDVSNFHSNQVGTVGYITLDISLSAKIDPSLGAVGVGFVFGSPNAAFEMSDRTYVDVAPLVTTIGTNTVCVPLKCFDGAEMARNWTELAQSFVIETSMVVNFAISNIAITMDGISTGDGFAGPCLTLCDDLTTYPSYKEWVNRQ